MTIKAFPYVWDSKEPTAQSGIAISNRRGRYPRIFLRTEAEVDTLINQLIELKEAKKTWQSRNNHV